MRIQLTPARKVHLIGLQILILVLLPIWLLKLFHYFFMPMYFMFDSPSMIPTQAHPAVENWGEINVFQTVLNMSAFLLFWVQHIIMASFKFKTFFTSRWPAFLFYERLFYNVISSILIFYILDIQVPQNLVIFTLPWPLTLPIAIIGFYLYVDSNLQLSQSLMTPYSFTALMNQSELEKVEVEKTQNKGIFITGSYRWMRHPMQSGFFMLLCFGNAVFTFEKCVMVTVLFICVIFGVWLEQKRLLKKYTQYAQYMKQIPYRFIPYVI